MIDRRGFLALAGVALAPGRQTPVVRPDAAQRSAAPHSSFDPWIEFHPGHLAHNVREVARVARGAPILAVIKNNGYGLGVVEVARVLADIPDVAGLAVIKLHEAVTLRDAGMTKPILLMGPFDERGLLLAHERNIMPMVYTPIGDALDRIAARVGRPVRIHVCVDTGIGRVGVPHSEAAALIQDLAGRRSVEIDGVMMTFAENADFDREQLRRFLSLTSALRDAGVTIGRRHAASSFALFQRDEAMLDMVRPGMALFGIYPEAPFRGMGRLDLRPAVALRARVAFVKKLAAGTSAGYGRAYVAKADTWVATLPVGHADGWPRVAANGARVRIGGRLYPVIASVSASHTIVEIGPEPAVAIGDEVTLFDWEEGSRPEDVSEACAASVYDLTMHLNPLLPRRVV